MKNLICTAFSFKEGFNTSTQTGKSADESTTITYLKNIFVTLTSAKIQNPDDEVALFTNVEMPVEWAEKLNKHGIKVHLCPFDTFVISKEFIWALAYYKLCVLDHIVKENAKTHEYDRILLMDADTYTARPYTDLWNEADYGVLMYQVGHDYSHPDRDVIRRDFEKFYPNEAKDRAIVHYGGEFVAGTQVNLEGFMATCRSVFETMTANGNLKMEERAGDETIWSAAAALTDVPVIHAGAYIFRFWTRDFYLVSSVTKSNPVCIWHIPSEKEYGFIRLYNYYDKHDEYPGLENVAKIMGIAGTKRPHQTIGELLFRVKRKING